MRFPGQRKHQHYFPVTTSRVGSLRSDQPFLTRGNTYICGIDQIMVDIESQVDTAFLTQHHLKHGESLLITDTHADQIYNALRQSNAIVKEYAGGTIGNTLHNYSVLADDLSVLLGTMPGTIALGDAAFHYLCNTSSRVDLSCLQATTGPIGRCLTFITPDGERSFGINAGDMNQLQANTLPLDMIEGAAALVIAAYVLRHKEDPIYDAAYRAVDHAKAHHVPVILTLGTQAVVKEKKDELLHFIKNYANVIAMNENEAHALTGESDLLLASKALLEYTDLILATHGPHGLYLSGYTEKECARKTTNPLLSGSIPDFNAFEFSRPMLKAQCTDPIKVHAHINPYMGGPEEIKNTNGAGDGALAALLHDIAANVYHHNTLPSSPKHQHPCLAYSSFSQICRYANRVSYEILTQNATRLTRGLPEKEDSLEEDYWER